MTAVAPQRPAARRWGWGISAVLYALLAINGGYLFFFQLGPATFMEDTGLTLVEVERVFPTVAAYLTHEVRLAAMLLTGVGLMALITALTGLRGRSRWAWGALWLPTALLAAIAAQMFAIGRLDIALYYLALTAAAVIGQLLAIRELAG